MARSTIRTRVAGTKLLTASDIRELASRLGIRPTKQLGQNFVGDAGTVRKIVREAGVSPTDHVLEIGPGLGSLTLALVESGAAVSAVEIDEKLAAVLPQTISHRAPDAADRFAVATMDAMSIRSATDLAAPPAVPDFEPNLLVANLPYNVAVPVILTVLEAVPSLRKVLVMVQAEVADRLAAPPGSRTYGVPSAKAAWYAEVTRGSNISRNVFWPVPNVDSALVRLERRDAPIAEGVSREDVFAVIDGAFSQRRKTLRSALATWAGSPTRAEEIVRAAGVDPSLRGERLTIGDFAAIAKAGATTH